jgi:hypothetical protein
MVGYAAQRPTRNAKAGQHIVHAPVRHNLN